MKKKVTFWPRAEEPEGWHQPSSRDDSEGSQEQNAFLTILFAGTIMGEDKNNILFWCDRSFLPSRKDKE